MSARTLTGTVVKLSMQKTILVRVDRSIRHPQYNKLITKSRTFPVHDERGEAKIGQMVTFVETRPISKTKRWRLVPVKPSA
jgi:small subunit ribosomal protein S17